MPDTDSIYTFTPIIASSGLPGVEPMDVRLQKLIAFAQQGLKRLPTASTTANEVAVIAKVTDVQDWTKLSEVSPGAVIGDKDPDGTFIVTARIPVSRIEFVRTRPFVKSLKAAKRLRRALSATTEEILARPKSLPADARTNGGKGVIVGIVDGGCDFAHKNFLTEDGQTRLKKLWVQWQDSGGSGPVGYGALYEPAHINEALTKPDPYVVLGYGPEPAEPAHGTHVMDIAAGNGRGSGVPGVAPHADLIFVDLDGSDIPWRGQEAVGTSFGDSVQLLEALKFIFDEAGSVPCAINVSLGTNGGPHDGSTLVEQGIDRLLRQASNRAVVIAASNSYADGIHAAGTVPKGGQFDLPWAVSPGDWTENELDLWYPGTGRLSVEIIDPQGNSLTRVNPNESGTVNRGGKLMLFVANRLLDPNNGDNMIGVFLAKEAPAGNWTLRLHGDVARDVPFHAWVERDDYGQSSFLPPHDNSHTVGSISCGHLSIIIGSYDAHKADLPLSYFSSAGPTRDGREKPEVSAPGHDVKAAKSRSKTGVTRMSGTSMAAPAVTGSIALMLAEAKERNSDLSIEDIRQAIIKTARHSPPQSDGWDDRYGFGRVSAAGLLKTVIEG